MSEQVDTYIGKLMKDGVRKQNQVGKLPLDIDSKDSFSVLVKLRKKLNATHVPKTDRFVMVGPEMEAALLHDERLDKAVNNSNLLNGEIGRLLGFGPAPCLVDTSDSDRVGSGKGNLPPCLGRFIRISSSATQSRCTRTIHISRSRPQPKI